MHCYYETVHILAVQCSVYTLFVYLNYYELAVCSLWLFFSVKANFYHGWQSLLLPGDE